MLYKFSMRLGASFTVQEDIKDFNKMTDNPVELVLWLPKAKP